MNVREFEQIVREVFGDFVGCRSLVRGKKFSFKINTDEDYAPLTFDSLIQLSQRLNTTLISINGGENCYCEMCGGERYCEITVELNNG